MNLDIGQVIKWNSFPFPKHGDENKARWFVCIGSTGAFAQFAAVYLCTTTTQLEKFKGHGVRSLHSHFVFDIRQFPMFDADCVIDFDEKPYMVSMQDIASNQNNLEIKGVLDQDALRMIYKRICSSDKLSFMEKLDIYSSYNLYGITGLKKPKRRKR